MMLDIKISTQEYNNYIDFLKNKVYKALPLREENSYWQKHLDTVLFEVNGFVKLNGVSPEFISIISKLEMLKDCEDFHLYRKTIFECLSSLDSIKKEV